VPITGVSKRSKVRKQNASLPRDSQDETGAMSS